MRMRCFMRVHHVRINLILLCDSEKAVSVSRAAQCNIRSSVLNQVVARYVLASLLSSLICRSHFMTDSDGFPQCPGMFVFQAVLQPT